MQRALIFVPVVLTLGVVAAVTFGSALLFQSGAMQRIYGLDRLQQYGI